MVKKEMIAMLLAGGQGSRLGVLTQKVAKPAVSFGGQNKNDEREYQDSFLFMYWFIDMCVDRSGRVVV